MVNFENLSATEVQRLAKQGDKEALNEMAYRFEFLSAKDRDNPVEQCAWQDYWWEKAAAAGHNEAKSRYALSLINRLMNAEDRQKAMGYFQSLVDDFDAGKLLSEDDRECGIISKLWLGILLCEGNGTPRDHIKGVELINAAKTLTKNFDGYGFVTLSKLGELFAMGYSQDDEEPRIDDLKQAIEYLELAINRFDSEKTDPEKLEHIQELLDVQKKHLVYKKNNKKEENISKLPKELQQAWFQQQAEYNKKEAEKRRQKMMEISDIARMRMDADKAALARLRQHLAQEGWDTAAPELPLSGDALRETMFSFAQIAKTSEGEFR